MEKLRTLLYLVVLTSALLLSACGGGGSSGDTAPPTFTSAAEVTVAENQTDVITLAATDEGTVTFGINGADSAAFVVNAESGVVTFRSAPDYETKTTYTFVAKATDDSGNETTQNVTVHIRNLNDNAPTVLGAVGVVVDVNESISQANWHTLSGAADADGDDLTATVTVNGAYGTFSIDGDTLHYQKTTETKRMDAATIQISDGVHTVDLTVVAISLYWKKIAAGTKHTLAIKSDGTLWAWGNNKYGQLGNGTTTESHIPVQVGEETNWKDISAGFSHSVALKNDGTLWAWGFNYNGQLGDGTVTIRSGPVQEASHSTWKHISAGGYHTAGIKEDDTLWIWGGNHDGQLGHGDNSNYSHPVQESSESNWIQVCAAGAHTTAIKTDGTLWSSGDNFYGQIGDDSTDETNIFTQEHWNHTDWKSIACGRSHTAAIKTDGSLWAWGYNQKGQTGSGSLDFRKTAPVREITHSNDWQTVIAGDDFTVAIKTDGSLWAWGENVYGQLGNNSTMLNKETPNREFSSSTDWMLVSAGANHVMATKRDGTLWAWGDNGFGQLGDGNATIRWAPVQNPDPGPWGMVSVGERHVVALKQDGTVWSWGYNASGQLGNGTGDMSNTPVQESTRADDWRFVSAGDVHTVAIKNSNTLWSWGSNRDGRLGNDSMSNTTYPVQEDSGSTWLTASAGGDHTSAIRLTDHTIWSWGYNYFGQLGEGTHSRSNVPKQESSGTFWSAVAAGGDHTVAIVHPSPSTLFGWGFNGYGELGDNTTTNRSTKVQEDTHHGTWDVVSAGGNHTIARDSSGRLFAWGSNSYGQLGDGQSTNRKRAYQIGSATDWLTAEAGYNYSLGLKNNGDLYAWGNNSRGQLGINATGNMKVPTALRFGGVENVSGGRYRSAAVKSDGTLWEWGEIYLPTVVPTRPITRH